jgi:branched-chain amino acid transport system substrate-binding protein
MLGNHGILRVCLLFSIFAVFTLVTACLIPCNACAADKTPVKIGLLAPFSPPGDPSAGKRMKWAAELAVKYVNEEMGGVLGGRPLELVVEDDAGTPAEGVAGYRKLVEKNKVVAVLGQFHSSVTLAILKVAGELGVPLFSTGASAPQITESQLPNIFSIMALVPDLAKRWVEFAKAQNWKRVAVLAEDTDYGTGLKDWVTKFAGEERIEVKGIIFPRATTDLTPALLEIKAWNPDLLIDVSGSAPAYLMVKQAYDIGLFPKVPMLGSFAWPTRPEYWDAVGDKGKYILYSAYYKPGMKVTKLGDWMFPRYKQLYNEAPDFFAFNAFGEVLVIAQALNLAQSDNPKALTKSLIDWVFLDWSAIIDFQEEPGMKWHQVSPPRLILQATEVRQPYENAKIVFPPEFGGDGKVERP